MADENENENTGQITVNDVKNELPPQDYETLTLGEDTVCVRCLCKAKLFVKGLVVSTGNVYDETNEVCREAVLKRTLYELFAFVGQEDRAKEKLEDCELLIESHFGNILRKNDMAEGSGPAFGVMSGNKRNPLRESF